MMLRHHPTGLSAFGRAASAMFVLRTACAADTDVALFAPSSGWQRSITNRQGAPLREGGAGRISVYIRVCRVVARLLRTVAGAIRFLETVGLSSRTRPHELHRW